MTSNQVSACCFTGFRHEGKPVGEVKAIGEIRTYFSYPANNNAPERAVIILSDVFGIFTNSQLLADDFAANGYLAIVPDLFAGDAMDLGDFEAGKIDIPEWISRHGTDATDPIIDAVIRHFRDKLGIKKIAGAGYCFGGKYVTRFLVDGKLDTGYSAHPSFVADGELAAIKKPFSLSAAENDQIFTRDSRYKFEEILGHTGQQYQINLFSGVEHGFSIRADLSRPENKFAKEQAFVQALGWFAHTLI
ncbi:dienelactone hydrolase family protein [Aspergillus pseudoustus]|uniref:Dienelactone hydrolase family protein n=1 Tax=Aspergillus pseudoustus TaxID=1810923 RepID=A0ABR4JUG6_9EURO